MAEARPAVISEVLFFINNTIDQHASSQIKSTILDFYRDDEIMNAKQTLIRAIEDVSIAVSIQQFTKKRIGDNKLRANIDDILNLYEIVDEYGLRDSLPIFCAADRARLPMLNDEMNDIAVIRLEISQLRQQVDVLTQQLLCENISYRKDGNDFVTEDKRAVSVHELSRGLRSLQKTFTCQTSRTCRLHL